MKTSIWKRFFRCGWNSKSARYNGKEAKRDAISTRTRLKRELDKLFNNDPEKE